MNRNFTIRKIVLSLSAALIVIMGMAAKSSAQTNLALSAAGTQSGGGPVNCATTWAFSPCKYNNDTIQAWPGTTDVGFVNTNGWIEYEWPVAVTLNKIVMYKGDRPMTNFTLQYWDGFSYVDVYTYNNFTNIYADSFTLAAPVNTIKLRFNAIAGNNNPNNREIQVWSAPTVICGGTPAVAIVPAGPLNPCTGSPVYLAATYPFASGFNFQWKKNTFNIPGATNESYVFYAYDNASYTVTVTCSSTGANATSAAVQVNVTPPNYAAIPYFQGFEAADTLCSPSDVPGPDVGNWTNQPSTGNNSWRRHRDGATALWSGAYTAGAYSPDTAMPVPGYSMRFHSNAASVNIPGNLDLYLNCSSTAGDKELYFYHVNKTGTDTLNILVSTDGGGIFNKVATFDTGAKMRRRAVPIQSNSATTVVRFQAMKVASESSDIGIDSVYVASPCSGAPAAGNISYPSPTVLCPGKTLFLTTTGTTLAGALVYQWQYSIDNGNNWLNVTGGSGFNTLFFTTPPIYDTIQYRLQVSCGANTATTNPVIVNVTAEPVYASLPYTQSFESWVTRCKLNDVPSFNWTNAPDSNNNSWRRNDQGGLPAGSQPWTLPNSGVYSPVASDGNFSARFHSNQAPAGTIGNLDLLIDCSTSLGDKELHFSYINPTGFDSLRIQYSSNGGNSFTQLTSYNQAVAWTAQQLLIPSNSATTILRFQGRSDFGGQDIGLDGIIILEPCDGTPIAGTLTSATPCPGINFTLNLIGATQAASIVYQWYDSSGTAGWQPISGATNQVYTTNITIPTKYKVTVTCLNSGIVVETPVQLIDLASFYYCYCNSAATSSSGADIGNFNLKTKPANVVRINNGVAIPLNNNASANKTYSDFRMTPAFLPPAVLYLDSLYEFAVTQINSSTFNASTVHIWLDTNRDGTYDPDEMIILETTSNGSNPPQQVSDTFRIPTDAHVGITGLRVILEQGSATPNPCGNYANGETEDYLVEIRYPPCTGPTNAGTAYVSDTSSCIGYEIVAFDTTHEKYRSGIGWLWQYSPDGNSWADMAGTNNKDSITHLITGPAWFRMRMICFTNLDTTYSNVVSVSINPIFSCYCFSLANGGEIQDSTDAGSFTIGNYTFLTGGPGPHVLNQLANRSRTDFTRVQTIHLWSDSTYFVSAYQIMRSAIHADAKVTLFMDFNNNFMYDPPFERIWTSYSNPSYFYVSDSITIPISIIPDLETGMRLIINNDIGPNSPSDDGCGVYTSGETEDYVVMFHKSPVGVSATGNLQQVAVYPNPTDGRFTVHFKARKQVEKLDVSVTNVTGQQVMSKSFKGAGLEFSKEFDLSQQPRGIYLVELRADGERMMKKVIVK
jgi:hypothetical protein